MALYKNQEVLDYDLNNQIMNALIEVSDFCRAQVEGFQYTKAKYREPRASMLSFSFAPDFVERNRINNAENKAKAKSEISIFIDRLNKWFGRPSEKRKKANTFKIHFVWVKEVKVLNAKSKEWDAVTDDEKLSTVVKYEHFHLMAFYDGKKATSAAFGEFLTHLESEGMIRNKGHKVSKENGLTGDNARSKCLSTRYDALIKHGSYLAKKETKLEKGRNWGKSQLRTAS